jgi:hypothetical protein
MILCAFLIAQMVSISTSGPRVMTRINLRGISYNGWETRRGFFLKWAELDGALPCSEIRAELDSIYPARQLVEGEASRERARLQREKARARVTFTKFWTSESSCSAWFRDLIDSLEPGRPKDLLAAAAPSLWGLCDSLKFLLQQPGDWVSFQCDDVKMWLVGKHARWFRPCFWFSMHAAALVFLCGFMWVLGFGPFSSILMALVLYRCSGIRTPWRRFFDERERVEEERYGL